MKSIAVEYSVVIDVNKRTLKHRINNDQRKTSESRRILGWKMWRTVPEKLTTSRLATEDGKRESR